MTEVAKSNTEHAFPSSDELVREKIHSYLDLDCDTLCTANEDDLSNGASGFCIKCVKKVPTITDWIDDVDGRTAICPLCGEDRIVPASCLPSKLSEAYVVLIGWKRKLCYYDFEEGNGDFREKKEDQIYKEPTTDDGALSPSSEQRHDQVPSS